MPNKFSRGSIWRKWDLHIHTPETLQNNQYLNNDWNEYIDRINKSDIEVS